MKGRIVSLALCTILMCLGFATSGTENVRAGTTVSGIVYDGAGGPWTLAGSPYWVVGDVTVPVSETLTVEPGVEVRFQGFFNLLVEGSLSAVGTAGSGISFTSDFANPSPSDWDRITVAATGHLHLEYGNVSYSDRSIILKSSGNLLRYSDIVLNDGNGISLSTSSDNEILGNNILMNGGEGLTVYQSSDNNTIETNTISGNKLQGIGVMNSAGNDIAYNDIISNDRGILIFSSSTNNTVLANEIIYNYEGIKINLDSQHNHVEGNRIWGNTDSGIHHVSSSNNTFVANTIWDNPLGIHLFESSYVSLSFNQLMNNGLVIQGVALEHWNTHQIDLTNRVNIKPIVYWKDSDGGTVPPDAGQVILANCTNVTVSNQEFIDVSAGVQVLGSRGINVGNNSLSSNSWHSIYIYYSSDSTISDNTIDSGYQGIYLGGAYRNTIVRNNVSADDWDAIHLSASFYNRIYHNNILKHGAYDTRPENHWNDSYPSGGNYWKGYAGVDQCSGPSQNICPDPDLIGDTPVSIALNGVDYYPLMAPYGATPPSAPQGLQSSAGDSYVNLTWTAPADDGGSPVTGYNIYRDGIGGIYDSVDSAQLWYNDTNVFNGAVYTYNVSAESILGEGPKSPGTSATPMTVPSMPQNIIAQAGDSYVKILWTAPLYDGGSPVTQYNIYRNDTAGAYASVLSAQLWYNDTNVANGLAYEYNVTAANVVGEGPWSNGVTATPMTLPKSPQNLQALAGDFFVNLTWTAPPDDGGSAVTGFSVYRGLAPDTETHLADTSALWFNDTTVFNGITYYYMVSAHNAVGEGLLSNEASATPATIPGWPVSLMAVASSGVVTLTWLAPSDAGGFPVTNYSVYRGHDQGSETLLVVLEDVLTYSDSDVANGATYWYYVTAINVVGEGPASNEANATPVNKPPACSINNPTPGQVVSGAITISGTSQDTDGTVEYVEVRIDDGNWTLASGNLSWTYDWNSTSISDGQHTVFVRCFDGENYSAEWNVTITVDNYVPPPPRDDSSILEQTWFWAIVVIVIVVISLLAILLWRMKSRERS